MINEVHRQAIIGLSCPQVAVVWLDLHRSIPGFPPLPEEYKELTPETSATLATALLPSSAALMGQIREFELNHAEVVLPICRRTQAEAVAALEQLIGHPLTRLAPRGRARAPGDPRKRLGMLDRDGQPRAPRQSTSRAATDTRTILTVAPNPKKPGSASHARYEHYVVGQKVHEAIAAGLTAGDIAWDVSRGFITLGV